MGDLQQTWGGIYTKTRKKNQEGNLYCSIDSGKKKDEDGCIGSF